MLISHKKKLLFVHIQKTAGSSMMSLLKDKVPDLTHYMGTHDHALWAKEKADFVWDDYYKFAFVRNPWDRLVSWYTMITQQAALVQNQNELNHLWRYVLASSNSFETFIVHCTDEVEDIDGRKSFMYNQLDYLTNKDGNIIVDFIGRFEALEMDAQVVFNRLGLMNASLPHHNSSKRNHYRAYYNEHTQQLVAERYAKDIAFFGYQF